MQVMIIFLLSDSKSHPYRGVENRIKKIASSSALANLPFIKKKQAPKSTEKSLTRSTSLLVLDLNFYVYL